MLGVLKAKQPIALFLPVEAQQARQAALTGVGFQRLPACGRQNTGWKPLLQERTDRNFSLDA